MDGNRRGSVWQRVGVISQDGVAQLGHFRSILWCSVGLVEIEQLRIEARKLIVFLASLIARLASRKLEIVRPIAVRKTGFRRNMVDCR